VSPGATPIINIAIESTMRRDIIGFARACILAHIARSLKEAFSTLSR
jgi:hypothetical protein